MGGAASKAGRKLPKRAEAPAWAGARTPHPSHPPPERPPSDKRASENRTQGIHSLIVLPLFPTQVTSEIERDAQDPDFLANLTRLGPVRVDHHMEPGRTTAAVARETRQLFKSRGESELEASSTIPVHNRLHAASLSDLLDKRKSARSVQDVEGLAKQYGIDATKLENLARFVSSPSVKSGSEKRTAEKDGEESVMIQKASGGPAHIMVHLFLHLRMLRASQALLSKQRSIAKLRKRWAKENEQYDAIRAEIDALHNLLRTCATLSYDERTFVNAVRTEVTDDEILSHELVELIVPEVTALHAVHDRVTVKDVYWKDPLYNTIMFKRAGAALRPSIRKLHSQATSSSRVVRAHFRTHPGVIISSGAVAAYILWYANNQTIHNDAASSIALGNVLEKKPVLIAGGDVADSENLRTVVWGSNRSNTLTQEPTDVIRTPSVAKWLDGVALRDLVIHKDSAACVDSRGDVYQWGSGFAGNDAEKHKPNLTLREKNITQLKITEGKLYALSASGKVYALSTESAKQTLRPGAPTPSSDSWWGTGWLWGEDETVDFVEIAPAEHLAWGEKFVSIEAGDHHVLALTSKGRTFAHPVNKKANAFGQLGFRKFKVPDPTVHHRSKANGHLDVELIPKSLVDPFTNSSRGTRPTSATSPSSENLAAVDDSSIRFCPNFFEIPVLKGIEMAQIAAGGRTSFARTPDGRVLGWGANDCGQVAVIDIPPNTQTGLGSNVALDTITVPTEVVLWNSSGSRTKTKCVDLAAGGDLTAFTVERTSTTSPTTVDLLVCGNGRWGGLGSNTWSSSQGTPLRARNVSGLLEYSDATQSLRPITPQAVTISPTGHVLLTLNTASTTDVGGRDLVVWGKNYESELGNGKKSSLPIPTTLETPEGGRFMLRRRKAKKVLDLHGKVWKRNVQVEQCAVVGPENSAVYWKII
ncbi:hypothetical protein DXG01_013333 [Tephrocybe rancida]|nr:hypothetical protein DXG01_013333 [Tephrocybe rancida]